MENKVIPRKIFGIVFLIPAFSIAYLIFPALLSGELQNISEFFKILHSAFAVTAAFCLIFAFLPANLFLYHNFSLEDSTKIRRIFIIFSFYLAFCHTLLFMAKIVQLPELETTNIEKLSFGFGIFSLILILIPLIINYLENLPYQLWLYLNSAGEAALVLIFAHLITQKYGEWLTPGNWVFYLPPISLIIAVCILFLIIIKIHPQLLTKTNRENE